MTPPSVIHHVRVATPAGADEPLPGYVHLYVADPFGNCVELLTAWVNCRIRRRSYAYR